MNPFQMPSNERRSSRRRASLRSLSGVAWIAAGIAVLLTGSAPGFAWTLIVLGFALAALRPSARNRGDHGRRSR
jgi:O-antigen ligase